MAEFKDAPPHRRPIPAKQDHNIRPPQQRGPEPEQQAGPPPIDFSAGWPADEDRPPIFATTFNLQVDPANTRIDFAELSQGRNWPRGAIRIPTNNMITMVTMFLALAFHHQMGKAVRGAKNPIEEAKKLVEATLTNLIKPPSNGGIIKP